MALENFNVFGAIVFVAQEMIITGTAVLKNKSQISRTRKFPVTFQRKNADEVVTFSALIEDKKISYAIGYQSYVISGIDVTGGFSETEHIGSAMETFLKAMDKAVWISENTDDNYVDRAIELEEKGLPESEIQEILDKEFPLPKGKRDR